MRIMSLCTNTIWSLASVLRYWDFSFVSYTSTSIALYCIVLHTKVVLKTIHIRFVMQPVKCRHSIFFCSIFFLFHTSVNLSNGFSLHVNLDQCAQCAFGKTEKNIPNKIGFEILDTGAWFDHIAITLLSDNQTYACITCQHIKNLSILRVHFRT